MNKKIIWLLIIVAALVFLILIIFLIFNPNRPTAESRNISLKFTAQRGDVLYGLEKDNQGDRLVSFNLKNFQKTELLSQTFINAGFLNVDESGSRALITILNDRNANSVFANKDLPSGAPLTFIINLNSKEINPRNDLSGGFWDSDNKLIYTRPSTIEHGRPDLIVADSEGKNPRVIKTEISIDSIFAAHIKNKVGFWTRGQGTGDRLSFIDTSTSKTETIISGQNYFDFQFSPTGKNIIYGVGFESDPTHTELWLRKMSETSEKKLFDNPVRGAYAWLDDANLAFPTTKDDLTEINILNTDSGENRVILSKLEGTGWKVLAASTNRKVIVIANQDSIIILKKGFWGKLF